MSYHEKKSFTKEELRRYDGSNVVVYGPDMLDRFPAVGELVKSQQTYYYDAR